ncbi:MAG: hydroxymethylbilane synthase [Proteobacteria bacterium]|nr:hydroxymethylbilane synthase [Pseudomonadota bacterium]
MVANTTPEQQIRIGTRGSPLALAQANLVRDALLATHPSLSETDVEIVAMSTKGDRIQDRILSELGGKGLFTEEIEDGLLNGSLDLAVHSMKDMPTQLPDGLTIDCILEREDVRDALISPQSASIADLPTNALVGTASLRRQAQIRRLRPDLRVEPLRGNVGTRLKKLEDGVVDATLLAMAGLNRLGMAHAATAAIDTTLMLPAIAQGAIGVESRQSDDRMNDLLAALNHNTSRICVAAERAFLGALDGSCRTPIAGLATISDGVLSFAGEILTPDGTTHFTTTRRGAPEDAAELGRDAGEELKKRAGPGFFGD